MLRTDGLTSKSFDQVYVFYKEIMKNAENLKDQDLSDGSFQKRLLMGKLDSRLVSIIFSPSLNGGKKIQFTITVEKKPLTN